jgi:hypothetical protein
LRLVNVLVEYAPPAGRDNTLDGTSERQLSKGRWGALAKRLRMSACSAVAGCD